MAHSELTIKRVGASWELKCDCGQTGKPFATPQAALNMWTQHRAEHAMYAAKRKGKGNEHAHR